MTDELDILTDAQLDEVFANAVAGWKRDPDNLNRWIPPGCSPLPAGKFYTGQPADFTGDANAVLPYLEKCPFWQSSFHLNDGCSVANEDIIDGELITAFGRTFARAATIALIRAKRATK